MEEGTRGDEGRSQDGQYIAKGAESSVAMGAGYDREQWGMLAGERRVENGDGASRTGGMVWTAWLLL